MKPTRKPANTVGNAVSARPTESHVRAAMLWSSSPGSSQLTWMSGDEKGTHLVVLRWSNLDLTHLGSHLAASCRSSMRTEFWIAPEDLQAGTASRQGQLRQVNRSAPPPDKNQPFRLSGSGSPETPKKRLLHSVDLPSSRLSRPGGILIKFVWQLATRLLHS